MHTISRRQLLGTSAIALARLLKADPLGLPIGCQVYPVQDSLGKDFEGTLHQIAAAGFKTIEMCSPPSYKNGFGPLVDMKASRMREIINAAGLRCESCHYGFGEFKESLDDRIAYAKELGLKQMILASFGLPKGAGMADWMQAAGELNKIGEQTRKAGIQLGYHNHTMEFEQIDGTLIYDQLMSAFDASLVKMQFQVKVITLGYQAATYFNKYPGRFISMHLADWSPAEKKMVPLGTGVVDWKTLFAAARKAGVKNYFLDMGSMDSMKASVPYLHTLKV